MRSLLFCHAFPVGIRRGARATTHVILLKVLAAVIQIGPVHGQTPASPASSPAQSPTVLDGQTYRRQALEVTDDTHRRFWMPKVKRYSGQAGTNQPDAVWGAGVMFSALVGATRHEPARFKSILNDFFAGLEGYWDTHAKIAAYEPTPRQNGNDKYYDDNAWMVLTFFEAYELTRNPKFRSRAEDTLEFVLSGWDEKHLGGGIWWHEAREKKAERKNTCANGPSAVGCLLSAKHQSAAKAKTRIEWARKIVQWTASKLQQSDGLFADSIAFDNKRNEDRLTYNAALMLRAFLGLHRATGKQEDLAEAKRIGRAGEWFLDRETGAFRDAVKWSHLMVEADLELHRATGEAYLLERAARNARFHYDKWKQNPPKDLIDAASIARILWLMADATTDTGKAFWKKADETVAR